MARVDGFECVGQVYTAAAAREAIERLNPDLLLLDVHLPDEDGIAMLRSLQAAGTDVDCIVITAAQDLATVKSAMTSGAVYYMVKPFSFDRLRTQLEAYRNWRQELDSASTADQATIDSLYNARSAGVRPAARRLACNPPCKKRTTPSAPPGVPSAPLKSPDSSVSAARQRSATSVSWSKKVFSFWTSRMAAPAARSTPTR
ncbi:probable C4-dicarboxylate response regulator DctR [Arthrobacter sp. Hiyo8]|nr:probable C4-dicarboxylate response regulator DctR [Arthrobacter sp. Hiyo8]